MTPALSLLRCIWSAAPDAAHDGTLRQVGDAADGLLCCDACGAVYLLMAGSIPVMLEENELNSGERAELDRRRRLHGLSRR